ncbi:MAG TPA: shikimate dehydrogenase [Gammaproteobacteria bacterium]|nr:shikimate dehydrogenase [Gammaproteobacteria bacterium]
MTDLFDFKPKPAAYAVMGNPVAHSKSPQIHAAFARQCNQRMTYTAIQVDVGGFAQAVGNFQAAGGHGLNITVPFKHEAWELCDELSARAAQAKAVNTIMFRPDGAIYGDNTDGVGLLRDLVINHGACIADRRVLVLGAGGAVRGMLGPLLNERPAQLVIANRTPDKARELAGEFAPAQVQACGYEDLSGLKFDLIINGTAASLQGELPPLPDGVIAEGGWCYDLMYAQAPTIFMRWAWEQGAEKVLDGLGMLVEQAAESFNLWRGVRPQTAPVIEELRRDIGVAR